MHLSLSAFTLLPTVIATIWGTCTPKATQTLDFNTMDYPTTLTEVYSCTQNYSSAVPPFFDWTVFSNQEQTFTTIQTFNSKPTLFPYTHSVTVGGALTRTEWVGSGLHQTFLSTVTVVETIVLETGNALAISE